MHRPTRAEFLELSRTHSLVPVYRQLVGDTLTQRPQPECLCITQRITGTQGGLCSPDGARRCARAGLPDLHVNDARRVGR